MFENCAKRMHISIAMRVVW